MARRPIKFALMRETTAITDADMVKIARAYNQHVRQLSSIGWPFYAEAYCPTTPDARDWVVYLTDYTDDPGALAYHTTTSTGMPVGYVFVRTCMEANASWTVAFSHECDEMLGDPTIIGMFDYGTHALLAEISDPVEADQYAIKTGNDVLSTGEFVYLTNSVSLSWFEPAGAGPWDLGRYCTAPLQVLHGGYLIVFDYATGEWNGIFTSDAPPAKLIENRIHRFYERQAKWNERIPAIERLINSSSKITLATARRPGSQP